MLKMKQLFTILFCLIALAGAAQYPAGVDSTTIDGHKAFVYKPAGSGPFPVMYMLGPQSTYADQSPGSLQNLYGFGIWKLLSRGMTFPYNIMVVTVMPNSYNDIGYADDLQDIHNSFMGSPYAAYVDSSKNADGTYKHMGIYACERGGATVFNALTWTAGTGWGSIPPTFFTRFKKIYAAGVYYNVYNVDGLASISYQTSNQRNIRFFTNSNGFFIDQRMYDSLKKNSPSGFFKIKTLPVADTVLYDSLASVKGLDSSHNIWLNLMDSAGTPPSYTKLVPGYVYELITYGHRDSGKAKFLADTTTGPDMIDPINDNLTFPARVKVRLVWPYKQFSDYWKPVGCPDSGKMGVPLLVDMIGNMDLADMSHKVIMNSVWICANAPGGTDTIFVQGFDTIFTLPVDQRWRYFDRVDSLPILGYIVPPASGGLVWASINLPKRLRYFILRQHLQYHSSGSYYTSCPVVKMVTYGTRDTGSFHLLTEPYNIPLPQQDYAHFVGENGSGGFSIASLMFDYLLRIYYQTNYFLTTHAPMTLGTLSVSDFADIHYDSMKAAGVRFWPSIKGNSPWVDSVSNAQIGNSSYQAQTDSFPQRTGDWHSYTLIGKLHYNLAALHGAGSVILANTAWPGGTMLNRGDWFGEEPGNEEDGKQKRDFDTYQTHNVVYDGYEGRIPFCGVKTADPNFILIASATTHMDTSKMRNWKLFSSICRTDKKLPFDWLTFHYYPRTGNILARDEDAGEQVGEYGESPWKDAGIGIQQNFHAGMVSYQSTIRDTSKKILVTEYGYGNWGDTMTTAQIGSAGFYDIGNVPSISGGADSLTEKAYLMAVSELEMMASGIYGYCEYEMTNSTFSTINTNSLFNSYGRYLGRRDTSPYDVTNPTPWAHLRACMFKTFGSYIMVGKVANAISDSMLVYKLRHKLYPDSICYVRVSATRSNKTLLSKPMSFGPLNGSSVMEVIMSTTSDIPTTVNLTATAAAIKRDVGERIVVYLVKQKGDYYQWKPGRKVVFK